MIDLDAALRGCDRGVIVTASDAGLCVGVNEGIRLALAEGYVSGASLLVAAPFAREAVRRLGGNLGVQLALSCEHEYLDLRPVTYAPSLLGGRGGFPVSADDAAEHADPEEVYREFRAQIERAKIFGVTPQFLASHDDVVARHLSLYDVFFDLADEYHLPIRHGYDFGSSALDAAQLARERGHFVTATTINWNSDHPRSLNEVIASLPEGVSEIIVSPAAAGMEMDAVIADGGRRVRDLAALGAARPAELADQHGVAWLNWGDLAPT